LNPLGFVVHHALAIADNQLALNAGWDEELLRAELATLAAENVDLTLLGFDDGALARLLQQDAAQSLEDSDAAPAPPVMPITELGDRWLLGDHVVLCGDATSREAIDTLLAGNGADMVFTDPPSIVHMKVELPTSSVSRTTTLAASFMIFCARPVPT
jgi:hypothetical protein